MQNIEAYIWKVHLQNGVVRLSFTKATISTKWKRKTSENVKQASKQSLNFFRFAKRKLKIYGFF